MKKKKNEIEIEKEEGGKKIEKERGKAKDRS